jgi:hypothetical protein
MNAGWFSGLVILFLLGWAGVKIATWTAPKRKKGKQR